ncbi:MAG TPA: GAF domain-containing sensor histidine kinase [Anaerolineales bacterium]|nr:GAF domain-containing sensor histidine kinase [Anaerolineales bacterium]
MTIDQTKLLARLLEQTRKLGTVADLDIYMRSILSAAAELTGSETASVLEYDEAKQDLYYKYVPWFHRDIIKNARVRLNESAAGWVYQQVKPLLINDVTTDPRYYSKTDGWEGFNTTSVLGVPLLLHEKPVGVFEVFNKMDGENYSDEDVLIMESLASLAAIAMQNDMLPINIHSSKDQSRELDRLKSEFIAITSHELRTPLGLILGHATFLRETVGTEFYEQMDVIIRSASRLKEIIENLSSVDNYQTGGSSLRSRKVSMARIIEDVSASFREMAGNKGVVLKIEIDLSQDLWLDVDGSKIAIALSNLLKNAVTFSNERGHIIIRAERQPDFIKVTVEDNGMGIPARELVHVFDRFYQVESHLTRKHGGMGLGLSVAKAMIELHAGRIWADSTEGLGSTFTFLLPVNEKNAEADPARPFVE